jgi:hypothetical protein
VLSGRAGVWRRLLGTVGQLRHEQHVHQGHPQRREPEGQHRPCALGARLNTSGDEIESAGEAVNGFEILEKLASLPISTWNYKWDPPSTRHLGPMAQDFKATFGLGDDDRTINMVDANGVVMVALQAIYRRVVALEERLRALEPGS